MLSLRGARHAAGELTELKFGELALVRSHTALSVDLISQGPKALQQQQRQQQQ